MARTDHTVSFDEAVQGFNSAIGGDPGKEIRGTPRNIVQYGSPVERIEVAPIRYYFYPTWRSQLFPLIGFFVLTLLSIKASSIFPWSIIPGSLFSLGNTTFTLHLPLFYLLPGFMLLKILVYIYDSKYIIDGRGVEAQVGLVSLSLRQPRLRYEDIRGVEPNQTLLERILGIGSVLIGSAMTQDVEIVMEGISDPRAIQLLIQAERDTRAKLLSGVPNGQQIMEMHGD